MITGKQVTGFYQVDAGVPRRESPGTGLAGVIQSQLLD
jgi:hypothetical protein